MIFYDKSGKRWKKTKFSGLIIIILILIEITTLIIVSLFCYPNWETLTLDNGNSIVKNNQGANGIKIASIDPAKDSNQIIDTVEEKRLFVRDKTVVLTFDDGPSWYTSKILDVLKEKQVKATFFVNGKEAIKNPNIIKRENNEGHEVANHTFSHIDLANKSKRLINLELNLNRFVIEAETKHSSKLFRPPYLSTAEISVDTEEMIKEVNKQGYLTIGEDLNSQDWQKPGVDKIIANSSKPEGGIILFHDGGGDRMQTVEALPTIIDYYKGGGYSFVSISENLGLPKENLFPSVNGYNYFISAFIYGTLKGFNYFKLFLFWIITAIAIGNIGRIILLTTTSLFQHYRRKKRVYNNLISKSCSIIIPAYNEEKVIESCLNSMLKSNYSKFEVILIDDGSTDKTIKSAMKIKNKRLKIYQKSNGGKAPALNFGIQMAKNEIIVAVDADTVFKPDTLSHLVKHFEDSKVGAVSGNAKVANKNKLITKLQSLEYIVSFNLDRRMGDLLDCITVVPGSAGAWRKSVIEEVGGFSSDTLAEDTDLTLSIKEKGYKIIYDSKAIAFTEAPSTVKDLLKQRFRWSFGTMQAAWKHRKSFLNPKKETYGLIGLPCLIIFQIFFPIVGPFFDIGLVFALISGQYRLVIIGLVFYTFIDLVISVIALKLDKEKLGQLWLLIPQRFIYRQLMYYIIFKSILNIFRGQLVGWGKIKRLGLEMIDA